MQSYSFIVLLICCVLSSANCSNWKDALARSYSEDEKDLSTIMHILSKPRKISADSLGFSYTDCSQGKDPMVVTSLSLMPDPIVVPGTIEIKANMTIKSDVNQPIKGTVEIEKKVLDVFVKIPCIDNVGSCHYDDVCSLDPYHSGSCPPEFQKFPCGCPFKKGVFSLPLVKFKVPINLPSFLSGGEYKATIRLNSSAGEAMCADLVFKLD